MAGVGTGAGLLQGMQGVAGLKQNAVDLQTSQGNLALQPLQLQEAKLQVNNELMQQKLMSSMWDSTSWERNAKTSNEGQQGLYNKLMNAGRTIMGVNPAQGLEFIKQAEDIKYKQTEDQVRNLSMQKSKLDVMDTIAYGVKDEASLQQAVQQAAEIGIKVPSQFQVWSTQAKEWWDSKAIQSKSAKQAIDINQKILMGQLKTQDNIRKDKDEDRKDQALKIKEGWLQHALEPKGTYKEPKLEEKATMVKELKDDDTYGEAFSDLKPGTKLQVVDDIGKVAFDKLRSKEAKDTETAFYLAKDEVMSKVKDGKYEGLKPTTPSIHTQQTPAKPTSQSEFDSLQTGDFFINPADGRVLQKQ